ncbi:hypothetical protein N752_00970 [Desulforamulus aquiferis]|nr:hypothetical protein N752_00970 [Desulforamulus aquiferis]
MQDRLLGGGVLLSTWVKADAVKIDLSVEGIDPSGKLAEPGSNIEDAT